MIKIFSKPKINQLNEIKIWSEFNYNHIFEAYENQTLAIINFNHEVVGYLTWQSKCKIVLKINILEIKKSHRRKGFGKKLLSYFIENKTKLNYSVISLENTLDSKQFWGKMGFIKFPEFFDNEDCLYKILIPTLKTCQENNADLNDFLELWDEEPNKIRNKNSTWKWEIQFCPDGKNSIKPIIVPCLKDWQINYTKNGNLIESKKLKYFNNGNNYDSSFLIIFNI